jgi:hypothetical protein
MITTHKAMRIGVHDPPATYAKAYAAYAMYAAYAASAMYAAYAAYAMYAKAYAGRTMTHR